jgi:hypothetical protein
MRMAIVVMSCGLLAACVDSPTQPPPPSAEQMASMTPEQRCAMDARNVGEFLANPNISLEVKRAVMHQREVSRFDCRIAH